MPPNCHSCQHSPSGGRDMSSQQNLKCILRPLSWVPAILSHPQADLMPNTPESNEPTPAHQGVYTHFSLSLSVFIALSLWMDPVRVLQSRSLNAFLNIFKGQWFDLSPSCWRHLNKNYVLVYHCCAGREQHKPIINSVSLCCANETSFQYLLLIIAS